MWGWRQAVGQITATFVHLRYTRIKMTLVWNNWFSLVWYNWFRIICTHTAWHLQHNMFKVMSPRRRHHKPQVVVVLLFSICLIDKLVCFLPCMMQCTYMCLKLNSCFAYLVKIWNFNILLPDVCFGSYNLKHLTKLSNCETTASLL